MLGEIKTARLVDERIRRKNCEDHKRENWISRRGRKEAPWRTGKNGRKVYLGEQRKGYCWKLQNSAWRLDQVGLW